MTRPKKPCPKCQLCKAAGMVFCTSCGAEIAKLRPRELIEVMLHPELYQPKEPAVEASASTPPSVPIPAPTESPQLIVMAADDTEDDLPVVEVDSNPETDPPQANPDPAAETAPPADQAAETAADENADQAAAATDSEPAAANPAPTDADGSDQAAAATTDDSPDTDFDEDAVTEEIAVRPPQTSRKIIVLAVVVIILLLAAIFYVLGGGLHDAMRKVKPIHVKKNVPAKIAPKSVKPIAKTPAKVPAKTDKAKPASGGLTLGPATVSHGKPGTVQVDLSNCGPGSVTVKGNKVLLKDCAKVVEPTEPAPSASQPADQAERERVRRQADALRVLREVRQVKPDPVLTAPPVDLK